MRRTFYIHLVLLFAAISYCSCDSPEVSKAVEFVPSMGDTIQDNFVHELGAVRKNIEHSANMYQHLLNKQCPFNPSILKPMNKTVIASHDQALRFGEFGASFVYSAAYNQPQYATDYLNKVIDMSELLGVENAFDEEQLKLLYRSDTDIDKSAIMTKAFLKATEQMYSEERAILVSYMVLGGWLEGMTMSYSICGDYLADDNVRLALYDQTYSFYNTKRILNTFKDNETSQKYMHRLLEIEPLIEEVVQSRGDIDTTLLYKVREELLLLRKDFE